jgi:hypothetical protein
LQLGDVTQIFRSDAVAVPSPRLGFDGAEQPLRLRTEAPSPPRPAARLGFNGTERPLRRGGGLAEAIRPLDVSVSTASSSLYIPIPPQLLTARCVASAEHPDDTASRLQRRQAAATA